jgi:hypothetical protein
MPARIPANPAKSSKRKSAIFNDFLISSGFLITFLLSLSLRITGRMRISYYHGIISKNSAKF